MSEIANAVAGTVADLFGEPAVAEETPNSEPTAADEPQVAELPDLNPELPEDILEFLEEPDDDDDEPQVGTFEGEEEEYLDPEALARENAKLKKRLEWTEQQKQKASRKSWSEEAKKIAPLARPETITATSRRAFLREARKQHEENFTLLAPHIDAYEKRRAEIEAEVRAEVRAELEQAWGRPTQNAGPSGTEVTQRNDAIEKARKSRNLAAVAKAMISNNEL